MQNTGGAFGINTSHMSSILGYLVRACRDPFQAGIIDSKESIMPGLPLKRTRTGTRQEYSLEKPLS